jgi:D-glycero-D-manno-heptose 1,7-bisphosphate phosphatase
MSNAAVFFDRDGTLIRDPGYLNHPDQVELLDGAAEALKQLQLLGYKTVVVSNQSGVARGIVTEEMLEKIHDRLGELLARKGASLDGIYYCPYHPDGSIPKYRKDSDWRKPRGGMLRAAAEQMDIDLTRSWMVGDNYRDIEAGHSVGCKTILTGSSQSNADLTEKNRPDHVAVNMREAINIIKRFHRSPQEGRTVPVFGAKRESVSQGSPPESKLEQQEDVSHESRTKAAPSSERTPAPNADAEQLLASILEQLRRMHKAETFHEFSLLRLLAGIVQIFVPFCLLIALWLRMSAGSQDGNILIAIGFAAVLQLMALTFYIMNGFR